MTCLEYLSWEGPTVWDLPVPGRVDSPHDWLSGWILMLRIPNQNDVRIRVAHRTSNPVSWDELTPERSTGLDSLGYILHLMKLHIYESSQVRISRYTCLSFTTFNIIIPSSIYDDFTSIIVFLKFYDLEQKQVWWNFRKNIVLQA